MNDTERQTEHDTPVIFTWADREGSSWWLAAFIFLSFLAHSAAFFIFQGKDPAATRTIRTAPLVQILSATSDSAAHSQENDALLRWIATHDPALVAKIQTVEPKGLLNVPYLPSFQSLRTLPLGAPQESATLQIPPAREPLALIRSVSPPEKFTLPAPASQPTQVRLAPALQSRSTKVPRIAPLAKVGASVQPTTVLAGVNGDGETRFVFVQQGSGDDALDAEAVAFVRAMRFTPSGDALLWDTLAIEWGDEVVAPATQK